MVGFSDVNLVKCAKNLEVPLLLVGLLFLIYVLWTMPAVDIRVMGWRWLALAFVAQFFAFFGACVGWHLTLRVVGGHLSVRDCIVHTGLLLVGKYIPGAWFGVIGRGVAAAKSLGKRSATKATLMDQLFYYGVALVLSSLVYISPELFVVVGAVLGLLLIIIFKWVSLQMHFEVGPAILVVFFAIVQWGFGSLGFIAAAEAINITDIDVWKLIGVYPAAVLAGLMLPFLPAGIGVREGVIVWLLTQVIGTSLVSAVTLAAASRLILVLRDVFAGILSTYLKAR